MTTLIRGAANRTEQLIPMISSPFWFEDKLTPEGYQKIGKLSLRWSHIDHLIANCPKKLLRLSDDEGAAKEAFG
jgi:hypothetical protein